MLRELYPLWDDEQWPSPSSSPFEVLPVVVHTFGRWGGEALREREIIVRLAEQAPVFVIEPPVFADDVALGRLDVSIPMPDIWRAVPRLPTELARDEEETLDRVRHFTQQMVGPSAPLAQYFPRPLQWFFTPLPAPRMLGAFGEVGVVYDCVDDRAWLRLVPRGAGERERQLLQYAHVVFASEASAVRVRGRGHGNVHMSSLNVAGDHRSKGDGDPWSQQVRAMREIIHQSLREPVKRAAPRPAARAPASGTPDAGSGRTPSAGIG